MHDAAQEPESQEKESGQKSGEKGQKQRPNAAQRLFVRFKQIGVEPHQSQQPHTRRCMVNSQTKPCVETTREAIQLIERPQLPNLFLEIGRVKHKELNRAAGWIHLHSCEACTPLIKEAWQRAQQVQVWVPSDRHDIISASVSGFAAGIIFGLGLAWLRKRIRGF